MVYWRTSSVIPSAFAAQTAVAVAVLGTPLAAVVGLATLLTAIFSPTLPAELADCSVIVRST